MSLVDAFSNDGDTTTRVLAAVLGLLGIIAGLVVMRRPGESLLAVLIVARDLAGGHRHRRLRPRDRDRRRTAGCGCSARVFDIVLGGLILALPDVSLGTLAVLIGIAFVVRGRAQRLARRRPAARRARMIESHLDEYRALRSSLEERILAIATSVDGRRFELQAPLQGLDLPPGGYAILESDGASRLGQVLSLRLEQVDAAEVGWEGERRRAVGAQQARDPRGARRGRDPDRRRRAVPRRRRSAPATPDEVAAWLGEPAGGRARLPVGELRLAPGVPFALDAGGFDRHTFFCGQSGSGKTYSLGVVLEQLLLETSLRIVILDPNSDMARLREVRDGVDEVDRGALARGRRRHRHPHRAPATARLRLRLRELSREAQAAMLRLDPVADREEHAALDAVVDDTRPESLEDLVGGARAGGAGAGACASATSASTAGACGRAETGESALAALRRRALPRARPRLARHARGAGARVGAVLGTLWERRGERQPVLIVIDEAHNVCPSDPPDALTALATEHAVRIAAEGRKFGLYLLVCTQRPQKVQENVISQCDNLVLMRMASAADLAYTGDLLSFAPRGLLDGATAFRLGEALVAGKLASHPALIRFGRRVAEEGGGRHRGRLGVGGRQISRSSRARTTASRRLVTSSLR